jgi:hypothetical protein
VSPVWEGGVESRVVLASNRGLRFRTSRAHRQTDGQADRQADRQASRTERIWVMLSHLFSLPILPCPLSLALYVDGVDTLHLSSPMQ